MAKIYYQQDYDLNRLDGKTVAIIGYVLRDTLTHLNLHDSGVNVKVAFTRGSKSWTKAEKTGLKVMTAADAAKAADIIMILLRTKDRLLYTRKALLQTLKLEKLLLLLTALTSTSDVSFRLLM